jgi:hypothetical protein
MPREWVDFPEAGMPDKEVHGVILAFGQTGPEGPIYKIWKRDKEKIKKSSRKVQEKIKSAEGSGFRIGLEVLLDERR